MIIKTYDYDMGYVEAGVEALKDYLLSEHMFWPLSAHPPEGKSPYPQLTLGGLLLSVRRLFAYPKSAIQAEQLNLVKSRIDFIHTKWQVAWEKKARHNFATRLHMWRDFIEEYRGNPQDNADRYGYEVRLRVMLQLLQMDAGQLEQSELDLLHTLDVFIKEALVQGDFVWEAELQSGFPVSDYWYLYGSLRTSTKMR
jgi:hypothetical protein